MDVIEKINLVMNREGISMYQLSKMTNISQSTIRSILKERKNPTFGKLVTICRALKLELSIKERDGEQ